MVQVRHAAFPYLLSLPEPALDKPPLLVFLHGAGERGTDPMILCCHSVPRIFHEPNTYPCVMVAPQCPDGETWIMHLPALRDFILDCVEQYNCDADRVSLTGISMGGYGTWELATQYPDLFSAIAPVCGGGTAWRASQLKDLPIWAFHGDCDTAVLPARSLEMVDAVTAAGGKPELTLFHNVGHDSWERAYRKTTCIDWLISQKRVAHA